MQVSWRESQPKVEARRKSCVRKSIRKHSYAPLDFGRPTDDLLTPANRGGIGKDSVGLAMFAAGLPVLDTVMTESEVVLLGFSSCLPHFQFVVTAPTAIYSLAAGALFVRVFRITTTPMRLWAGPLDARLSLGHHSPVIRPLFHHGHVVRAAGNSPLNK